LKTAPDLTMKKVQKKRRFKKHKSVLSLVLAVELVVPDLFFFWLYILALCGAFYTICCFKKNGEEGEKRVSK
jgi:hypothetical protein